MPTLLITGANRGLGLEFTRQYANDKWQIIACCRAPERAEQLLKLAKANSAIRIEALDVANHHSIRLLAQRLQSTPIDILINNAGILSGARGDVSAIEDDPSQTFGALDPAAWSKVFLVNSIAPILVAEALANNVAQGGRKIIANISSRMGSIASLGGKHDHLAYRTSKAALNAATHAVASTLSAKGITMVSFHPGWVRTDMGGSAATLSLEESIGGMRKVMSGLTPEQAGRFLGYDGQVLPW